MHTICIQNQDNIVLLLSFLLKATKGPTSIHSGKVAQDLEKQTLSSETGLLDIKRTVKVFKQ